MPKGCKTKLDKKYRIVRMIIRGEITRKEAARKAGVSERTIRRWLKKYREKGRKGLQDKRGGVREKTVKVTKEIADQIAWVRRKYNWGSSRIRKVLMAPPKVLVEAYKRETGKEFKRIKLARSTIIKWLKKLGLNGSPYKNKKFRYARFEKGSANEMWQMDIDHEKIGDDTKYIALIVDDYSRFLIGGKIYDHPPNSWDTAELLDKAVEEFGKPKSVLVDNGSEFKKISRKGRRDTA